MAILKGSRLGFSPNAVREKSNAMCICQVVDEHSVRLQVRRRHPYPDLVRRGLGNEQGLDAQQVKSMRNTGPITMINERVSPRIVITPLKMLTEVVVISVKFWIV